MESLTASKLYGPYRLDEASLCQFLRDNWVGVYVLTDNSSNVRYVGRSDSCLKNRLRNHLGKHPLFYVSISGNVKVAYEDECRLYHRFQPTGAISNEIHPAKSVISYQCPVLGCYQ